MPKLTRYVRKPFYVDAVQVTEENMQELSDWCRGEIRTQTDGSRYIKVSSHRPVVDRQTKAFAGDWILLAVPPATAKGVVVDRFKVYLHDAFRNSFDHLENVDGREKVDSH